jgi:acetoin utilization deacetylase AcuC-like enzyme
VPQEKLAVLWHPDVLLHDPGRGCYEYEPSSLMAIDEPHPECPERLVNMKSILERGELSDRLTWPGGRRATRDEIELFHTPAYLDAVIEAERSGPTRIDGSGTVVAPGSVDAALAAAGSGLEALDAVLSGTHRRAYAMVRPPGHHAGRSMGDGSCIFNNLAIAVEAARLRGIERVAVVDWDVHHGNGTQSGFYDCSDVFTISMHMPLGAWGANHPETGAVDEVGQGDGVGFNLNIPLPFGTGDLAYRSVMEELVRPAIDAYRPELLVIACGEDASQFDSNGRNLMSMRGFYDLGRIAREIADDHCEGRLLLMQEGGYAVTYAAFCLYAALQGVTGVARAQDFIAYDPDIEQPEYPLAQIPKIRDGWQEAIRQARHSK